MRSAANFLIAVVLCSFILILFPYDKISVAKRRLESQWAPHTLLIAQQISAQCGSLLLAHETAFSPIFSKSLTPLNAPNPELPPCSLFVESAQSKLSLFLNRWAVQFQVVSPKGEAFIHQTYLVEAPSPLCLLPIALLFLATVLHFRWWNLGFATLSYCLLLNGLNLVEMVRELARNTFVVASSDTTFYAFLMIALWLSIALARATTTTHGELESSGPQRWAHRSLVGGIGLWNPILYSFIGSFLFPPRTHWVKLFMNSQFLLALLSLYLLSLNFEGLSASLLLPRYFTFAAVLFFTIQLWIAPQHRPHLIWRIPNFLRAIVSVFTMAALTAVVPELQKTPFLFNVGIALVLSELLWPFGIPWRKMGSHFLPWAGAILLSSLISFYSAQKGAVELVLTLFNPNLHPSLNTLLTFLSGIFLGIITGSVGAVYFTLTAFLKMPQSTLLQAAALDGILLGCLLSPFSLLNLIPAQHFQLSISEWITKRLNQALIPCFLGSAIFLLSTLHSVALLRPVTFVFGCLVILAYQLKQNQWTVVSKP